MSSTALREQVSIELGDRSYVITIGAQLLSDRDFLNKQIEARDLLVVTNETVAPLYLDTIRHSLVDRNVRSLILKDGEQFKTLDSFRTILDALVEARFNRDAAVIALGGGVIGDMSGFAAACYQRGIDYIQVPTTLLAQVDSSVGGKTAVNHPKAKNMIGAFYQPRAVIADTSTLATLPEREFRAGIAEVVKYGFIYDIDFLAWLEANAATISARDEAATTYAVRRSCEIKAAVVGVDEREQGLRAILNLGHTFGHAIETATDYTQWLHGEAVAAGMVMAADLSHRLGWISQADLQRVIDLTERFQLPTRPPRIGAARGREMMGMDKKVLKGTLRLVLLRKLGQADIVSDYSPQALDETLRAYFD
ncbi:MAG TPA: 3-dehydroquinate synthase [Steroidobacteraceae bacterium]|nr:3-dehydroquinate synthase [Steroidobacteraceae bacterium]